MNQISYKHFFATYGIFVAILVVVFGLLIYPVKAGQKAWNKNLKSNLETALDEIEPNGWTLGNPVKIKNPFTLSAACFEARNKKSGEVYKVLIFRFQAFYGPMAGIFSVDKDNNVELLGYFPLHGRIKTQLELRNESRRLKFWKERIPQIIQQTPVTK